MPTIFAIDGAEDYFGDLGAYSSGVASLQTALIALGQKIGDSTLAALVLDGLIGPKTTAAANRAFTMYISNAPNFAANGSMSQSQVASAAEELAGFVKSEIARRSGGSSSPAATAVRAPSAAAVVAPAVSDTSAQIVKYAAIGLGGVVVASLLYYMWRRSQGRPVFGGVGGCDFGAAGIDDHVRVQWVDNDPRLQALYQRQSYPLRQFIKKNRAKIDAAIQRARGGLGGAREALRASIEDTSQALQDCRRQHRNAKPGSLAARNLASRCRKLTIGLDWLKREERGSQRWR